MLQKMVKICLFRKLLRKKMLFLLMLTPALSFSQGKPDGAKKSPDFWIGAGYAFYPGSSADVKLGQAGNNPLKSGFTAEFSAEKQMNSFLYVGVGASLFSYKDLNNPYIPVFADIRVIGVGTFKFYSFLNPGYGFYQNSYYYPLIDPAVKVRERGGFFIAYGVGVTYKKVYLQARYNWLRFSSQAAVIGKSSKAYGVAGISFGVRLR
jgi:hypothetical protein